MSKTHAVELYTRKKRRYVAIIIFPYFVLIVGSSVGMNYKDNVHVQNDMFITV